MSSSCGNGDGPISGICIIADHTRAPSGYTVIRKAYDDPTRDADLHRDGIFRRIDRYMCVTRYPFVNVVEDIILINSNDTPPSTYTALNLTVDTKENATSKKTICVRMSPRSTVQKAVGDIIFLSKQKRPPPGYSLLGELNNLLMCYSQWILFSQLAQQNRFSESTVHSRNSDSKCITKHTQQENSTFVRTTSLYSTAEKLLHSSGLKEAVKQPLCSLDNSFETMTIQRDDYGWAVISAIPFHFKDPLNVMSFNKKDSTGKLQFPVMQIPSIAEIESKYNYEFRLERAWIST
ncbi:hypothetical protein GJ496_006464 [Pomphorhynchus laevis]|nr:hypothetical protein GJ496_006464 [Pomphorhynchus laevis]